MIIISYLRCSDCNMITRCIMQVEGLRDVTPSRIRRKRSKTEISHAYSFCRNKKEMGEIWMCVWEGRQPFFSASVQPKCLTFQGWGVCVGGEWKVLRVEMASPVSHSQLSPTEAAVETEFHLPWVLFLFLSSRLSLVLFLLLSSVSPSEVRVSRFLCLLSSVSSEFFVFWVPSLLSSGSPECGFIDCMCLALP